jgi:hypothetical protein
MNADTIATRTMVYHREGQVGRGQGTKGSRNQPAQDDEAMSRDDPATTQARNARTYMPYERLKEERQDQLARTGRLYIQSADVRLTLQATSARHWQPPQVRADTGLSDP